MQSWRSSAGRLGRLVRKEVTSILRDRRTIVTLVFMPLLLYPLLAIAFTQMAQSSQLENAKPEYRIGFVSDDEERAIWDEYWAIGIEEIQKRQAGDRTDEKGEPIRKEPPHLKPMPQWKYLVTPDLEDKVRSGEIDVGVRRIPDPSNRLNFKCEILYREDSASGREAARYLEEFNSEANVKMVSEGLRHLRIPQRADPMRVQVVTVPDPNPKRSSLLPVLIPLILILMTITGAVYPAIDLTAGERERGTLEVLVAAPVPRMSLLFAKYVAVWVVATLTALANLFAMVGTLVVVLQMADPATRERLMKEIGLTFVLLVQVLGLMLLFAAFFSGVLLAVTSFARSFKEAQAYLVPLMLLSISPGVVALMPGLSLNSPLSVVPLLNIVLLARDLFEGTAQAGPAAIVICTTLLYALAAIGLSARIFGSEAVLYSEQGNWADLFRRPVRPRPEGTLSGALMCLALMFPASFLLTALFAQARDADFSTRLLLQVLASVILFGGFPAIAGYFGHLDWKQAFRFDHFGGLGWVAALLLGVGLWPLIHELIAVQKAIGISTLGPQHQEQIEKAMAAMRSVSPILIVVVFAVIPAVLEELVFRGYLFSALARVASPALTIGASAFIFGLFHLIVTDMLVIERFLPSTVMGLVLGTVAWKSKSVLPGMLLHTLHNGLIVLLGYYQPQLEDRGWIQADTDHLPWWLLLASVVVSGLAVLVLMFTMGRSQTSVSVVSVVATLPESAPEKPLE